MRAPLHLFFITLAVCLFALPAGAADRREIEFRDPGASGRHDYGISVAASADVVAVGAPGAGSDAAGEVHLLERVDGAWRRGAVLAPDAPSATLHFGSAVAMDGDLLVVATSGHVEASRTTGAVQVFRRSGGAWTHEQTLTPPDPGVAGGFGVSLAVDGELLVVGDDRDVTDGAQSGKVHVYRYSGATLSWAFEQTLAAQIPKAFANFGDSVATDGARIAVGARGDEAFVFSKPGSAWTLEQQIAAGDDGHAHSVDIEGDTLVVGNENVAHSGTFFAGAVDVFVRDGPWRHAVRLTGSDAERNESFGTSVVLSGATLLVGARGDDLAAADAGSVTVFRGAGDAWVEQSIVTLANARISEALGAALALSGDEIVAGTRRGAPQSGSVFVIRPAAVPDGPDGALVPSRVELTYPVSGKRGPPPEPGIRIDGMLDTGAAAVDLTAPTWLFVGGRQAYLPGLAPGKKAAPLVGDLDGIHIELRPSTAGSSHTEFRVAITDDLRKTVKMDGELEIVLATDAFAARGTVRLADGAFRLGHVPGSLLAPAVDVRKLKAKVKGEGRDAVSAKLGIAGDGTVPEQPRDVTVGVGDWQVTVPAGSFRRKGSRDVFKGKIDGLRSLILDHARGLLTMKAKRVSLGQTATEPAVVRVTVRIGDGGDATAIVRTAVKRTTLRY